MAHDELDYRTLDGDEAGLDRAELAELRKTVQGRVLTAEDEGYDVARSVWNAMVDRRPALLVQCESTADISAAITFAREHAMLLGVKGGGHHIAGNAVPDGGLTIDLSGMNGVQVDADRRVARVGGGATLGDFDRATQPFGLATPLGINSTTGVGGLTLGGGFGWLTRKYGLTIDNLLSAEIVTADGRLRTASEEEEPDLFWAIRGGGGNFGVVASFTFALHDIGNLVQAGVVVYPFDRASEVLRAWRDFNDRAPDDVSAWSVLRKAPPLPFLPPETHGTDVVVIATLSLGEVDAAARRAAPLFEIGAPLGSVFVAQPYASFQTTFDPLLAPGARNYWKSHDFASLSDEAIDAAIDAARGLAGAECEIFFGHVGGAMGRVPSDATAWADRRAQYMMNVHGRWRSPSEDATVLAWARSVFQSMAPYATGGGYVNFLTADEASRVASAYGANYERLREVKRKYDPDNLFRMNHNVPPAEAIEGRRVARRRKQGAPLG